MKTAKADGVNLAQRILDAALRLAGAHGRREKIAGYGCVIILELQGLTLLHPTPCSRLSGAPGDYGIDIWANGRKGFSAWWAPLEVVRFKPGEWIEALVQSPTRPAAVHPPSE